MLHVYCRLLPQVALWVGERLADPYRHKYLPTDNDMPLHKEFQPADLEDRCVMTGHGGLQTCNVNASEVVGHHNVHRLHGPC